MDAFLTSTLLVALAEIGDKTQVATIAMAAKYNDLTAVVMGTTLGMMVANVPVVFLGERIVKRLPLKTIRWFAAGMFVLMGAAVLLGLGA